MLFGDVFIAFGSVVLEAVNAKQIVELTHPTFYPTFFVQRVVLNVT